VFDVITITDGGLINAIEVIPDNLSLRDAARRGRTPSTASSST